LAEPDEVMPVIPGYKLTDRLGKGSQANVYRGVQVSMKRPVAVKIIPPDHPDQAAEVGRFLRESEVLAKMRHDNIVQAIDFGEHDGVRYLVMEYIEGDTVSDLINAEGALGIRRSVETALHVCRALAHAAKFEVIHRDVKPANIVISKEGRAVLVDFGLAKPEVSDVEVTRAGISMGTPHYMAPEQIKGEVELDHRADIYALGGTFFHMLTGSVPFPANRKMQILIRHLKDPVRLPENLPEKVPGPVFAIVRKAMAKNRDERYWKPEDMIEDLEAALEKFTEDGRPRVVESRKSRRRRGEVAKTGDAVDAKARKRLREITVERDRLTEECEALSKRSEEIRRKAREVILRKTKEQEDAEARAAASLIRITEVEDELRSAKEEIEGHFRRRAEPSPREQELAVELAALHRDLLKATREHDEMAAAIRMHEAEDEKRGVAWTAEREESEHERDTLVARLTEAEKGLEENAIRTEKEVNRLETVWEKMRTELTAERDDLRERVGDLQKAAAVAQKNARVAAQRERGLTSKHSDLLRERDGLAERLTALEEADETSERESELRRAIAEREERVSELTRSLSREHERASGAEQAHADEQHRADEISQTLAEEQERANKDREVFAAESEQMRADLESERGILMGECERLRGELETERGVLTHECERLRGELEEKDAALVGESKRLRAEFATEREALNEECERLRASQGTAVAGAGAARAAAEDGDSERDALRAECERLRAQLDKEREVLMGECQRLRDSLETEREASSLMPAPGAAIGGDVSVLRRQLAEADEEREDLEDRITSLTDERRHLNDEARDLRGRIDALAIERNQLARTVEELQSDSAPVGEDGKAVPLAKPIYAATDEVQVADLAPEETGIIGEEVDEGSPMVFIDPGFFIAGEDEGRDVEKPRRRVRNQGYWIDVFPVTNDQYALFVELTGHRPPDHWDGVAPTEDIASHPVVRVTWQDAIEYSTWFGKRLPTMLEWQRAARGSDGRSFPWGDEEDISRLNCKESGIGNTTPAGLYKSGVSPSGLYDSAGNVAEWVYGKFNIPGSEGKAPIRPVCGGSWRDPIGRSRCAARRGYPDGGMSYYVGFRCAKDA
jgi:serine/threonine protein kinase/formylglycine-generating enzyme required for sulfatase activity